MVNKKSVYNNSEWNNNRNIKNQYKFRKINDYYLLYLVCERVLKIMHINQK